MPFVKRYIPVCHLIYKQRAWLCVCRQSLDERERLFERARRNVFGRGETKAKASYNAIVRYGDGTRLARNRVFGAVTVFNKTLDLWSQEEKRFQDAQRPRTYIATVGKGQPLFGCLFDDDDSLFVGPTWDCVRSCVSLPVGSLILCGCTTSLWKFRLGRLMSPRTSI